MSETCLTRREFLRDAAFALSAATMVLPGRGLAQAATPDRPNILWIVSEDNTTLLGCYGDKFATTPRLDRLAREGVLYENAFANTPVCAPSRATLITGMYALCLGSQHMRSKIEVPAFVRFFPSYLREAGYYCTNNAKEDYNMPKPAGVWDESSRQAHYQNRRPGQPFFAVFNIATSHESCLHQPADPLRHDPAKVVLPPYHPDTPELRHDWAQYYDKLEQMDAQVARLLAELDQAGLADDTIVFYYADNGGVLPRSKRFLYDSGTHVPLIVRVPPKYQYLAAAPPGCREARLVSFVDFAPTVLNLARIPVPDHMQGLAFLGPNQPPPRDLVYLYRDRMDHLYDMSRAVRDRQFKYIRNYYPQRPQGAYQDYFYKQPSVQSWRQAWRQNRCNVAQSRFWLPKPPDELYDVQADHHEVNNLADKPEYRPELARLRQALDDFQMKTRDAGLLPESDVLERAAGRTVYDVTHDPNLPLTEILATANRAAHAGPGDLPWLQTRLKHSDPAVRYWAAVGCAVLAERAAPAEESLLTCLKDASPNVRIAAAEALCACGQADRALPVLVDLLEHTNGHTALHALNIIDFIGQQARPAVPALRSLLKRTNEEYIARTAEHVLAVLTEAGDTPNPPPRAR